MEKGPHKSSWKERKRRDDLVEEREEKTPVESDLRESLNKVKKYTMILCGVLAIGAIGSLFSGWVFYFLPIIAIIAIFIAVFFIYFPVADLLKNPETR